jgi:hypothetical protein
MSAYRYQELPLGRMAGYDSSVPGADSKSRDKTIAVGGTCW